jgi:hypothetical protein
MLDYIIHYKTYHHIILHHIVISVSYYITSRKVILHIVIFACDGYFLVLNFVVIFSSAILQHGPLIQTNMSV